MKVFEHTQFKEKQISRLSSYRKSDHSRNVLNKIKWLMGKNVENSEAAPNEKKPPFS